MTALIKQRFIDPEICVRRHTCEETGAIDVIARNDDNVVVDASKRNFCMARDGERPITNNLSLTVKREGEGVASSFLCALEKRAVINISGLCGPTFLAPQDPEAEAIMICSGGGVDPATCVLVRRGSGEAVWAGLHVGRTCRT